MQVEGTRASFAAATVVVKSEAVSIRLPSTRPGTASTSET